MAVFIISCIEPGSPYTWLSVYLYLYPLPMEQEHPRGSMVEPQYLHQDGLNSLPYNGSRFQLSLHICMKFSKCKGKWHIHNDTTIKIIKQPLTESLAFGQNVNLNDIT